MEARLRIRFLQTVVAVALLAMVTVLLEKCFWVAMGALALDGGPIPRAYTLNAILLIAILTSAVTLWKWPWTSLLVAWINLITTVTHFVPWNDNSLHSFISGFAFDHIFFISANLGAIAVIFKNCDAGAEASDDHRAVEKLVY